MSDQETAGFRNAGWTMPHLPPGASVSVHPLATADGAAVNGFLFRAGASDVVLCIMHPREFLATHYLVPELLEGGFNVWTQTSRSVGNDLRLEHEVALIDVAAGLNFLRASGFKKIILIGNSGGSSLYAFYNQQSLLAPERRLTKTPGGRPVKLANLSMPEADGVILVSPHPGQGMLLMNAIDPAVIDEHDPLRSDPALDFLNPENGYRDGPAGSHYAPDFITRYRAAQRARVQRLDETAKSLIEERLAARKRAKDGGSTADRVRGAHSEVMTVWRTDAELRCWDISLDPSDRAVGSLWGKDPFTSNYGAMGFARFCTPEAWLSTWSGLSSRANVYETAKSIEQPCLQIEYTGDNALFPADGETIFNAIPSRGKQKLRYRGDHHGRALVESETPGRKLAGRSIRRWTAETFGS
ncbi:MULTISPECIES: alpha/beta hydrolase [unclassified Beijerinckia]|uniref:alpha/beta hydrolase n=1 Tax=unclassified Beijerinckia TaxID=2638183 RepID=UPI00089C3798|nr:MULTISPECIES: alpha/beta hydrolase [unclassified Beijerinckia]MDH7795937.1 hypothetical protein [Beijerinckia sp. GAS462]SEC22977.1 hypothetical protein SAMN05443249_2216 [Beijerinckia sp. 28-YEA-48]